MFSVAWAKFYSAENNASECVVLINRIQVAAFALKMTDLVSILRNAATGGPLEGVCLALPEQGQGNTRWIPPDLEAKAQHHENGVGGLPSQQQGSQTWAESQLQQRNPALLLWAQIPRSNIGQVAHVPPTSWVTSQEANITRRTLEAACWGAGATTLRTATLALVHSTAEYCAPVRCRSAHTRIIDPTINNALQIVTGCLRPTPADNLSILAGIQSAELRHRGATLSLGHRAMEHGHLLHSALTRPSDAAAQHLKSRHPFVPAAQQLISFSDNKQHTCSAVGGSSMDCRMGGQSHKTPHFNSRHRYTPTPRMTLSRRAWVRLNCLRRLDVSAPACTNGVWPLRPVSVAQNKLLTMPSSTVQSIDLPMDYTAWRFWTMRQLNGCPTPAPYLGGLAVDKRRSPSNERRINRVT